MNVKIVKGTRIKKALSKSEERKGEKEREPAIESWICITEKC